MQSVNAPPSFVESPGEPQIQWKYWFDAFETYLGAISALRFRPERKKWLLLHSLGFKGRSIYKHIPDLEQEGVEALDEHQTVVKKLDKRFDSPPSSIVTRHQFFKRTQNQLRVFILTYQLSENSLLTVNLVSTLIN